MEVKPVQPIHMKATVQFLFAGNVLIFTSTHFFCLGFVLDFSRSDKVFPLFFSQAETKFLGKPYFSETSLLLIPSSKSFIALHFSSTVLFFRCLFGTIIEKIPIDKTSNQSGNVLLKSK